MRNGPNIPIRIVAEPSALVSSTLNEVASTGFWKLSFSIEGETNAVEFIPRPSDIYGPPVYEVSALVTPAGTTATTNSPTTYTTATNWGRRVFFCVTPNTTAETLYTQMRDWQDRDAEIYWDGGISSIIRQEEL